MADPRGCEEERRLNVRTACIALAARGEGVGVLKVAEEALRIASLSADDSIAVQAQAAARIRATVKGVSFEENSHRYVVRYVAANGDGAEEQIRSDRVDRRFGGATREMFSNLRPGDEVVLYKLNEPAKEESRMPSGYRRAVYVTYADGKPIEARHP